VLAKEAEKLKSKANIWPELRRLKKKTVRSGGRTAGGKGEDWD